MKNQEIIVISLSCMTEKFWVLPWFTSSMPLKPCYSGSVHMAEIYQMGIWELGKEQKQTVFSVNSYFKQTTSKNQAKRFILPHGMLLLQVVVIRFVSLCFIYEGISNLSQNNSQMLTNDSGSASQANTVCSFFFGTKKFMLC